MSGHEIGMKMGFEDMADSQAMLGRSLEVKLDVPLRIDHYGFPFRSQHVRGVRKTSEIELFEIHRNPTEPRSKMLDQNRLAIPPGRFVRRKSGRQWSDELEAE